MKSSLCCWFLHRKGVGNDPVVALRNWAGAVAVAVDSRKASALLRSFHRILLEAHWMRRIYYSDFRTNLPSRINFAVFILSSYNSNL
jgi:hypothetical protein